jgi:hypothetical protein
MYLVELEAGREELYPSVDALATAIRRGEVGPKARIYHRASSSWVSITVHPEYKKAAAAHATEPLPPLARHHWTFFGIVQHGREYDEPTAQNGSPPAPPAPESSPSRPGWRGILGRVFRRHAAAPKPSGSPGS